MKKNIISLKKIIIILILILLIFISTANAFEGNISDFANDTNTTAADTAINRIGGTVISVIRIISVTIALVMLLVIAIRYMVSAPGDRADIKKHAVVYVVGAFILFGVSGILTILIEFSKKITLSGE